MDNISHYEYITKSNSIWKDIYNNLKDWYKGEVSIYPAGIKTGECIMPYIVVEYSGGSKLSSLVQYAIITHCYCMCLNRSTVS